MNWQLLYLSRDVSRSRKEHGFCGRFSFQDHRKLGEVDPSSCPMNLWLNCGEPRVSEDDIAVTQPCQEEPHFSLGRAGLHFQVSVEMDCPCHIFRSIDVDDLPWFDQSFEGDTGPSRVLFIDEVFRRSSI